MRTLYGPSAIARLLGVTRSAVSNWLVRHHDTPAPVAITHEHDGYPRYLWDEVGLGEWENWHNSRQKVAQIFS